MPRRLEDARARLTEATKGISALCVRRPVLTIVFNLLIIVAGLAAFQGVEIREMPDVDRPVITIRASYDGAAPETIDTQVTRVLEGAASRVPGVKAISSNSESGSSRIVVEFDKSADLNIAANDLRDAVGNAERQLPDDVEDVSIVKADDNSDAIIRLAVTAADMTIQDLTQLVEDNIVDRLAAVDGVADVTLNGDREPLVRVLIDPQALAARALTIADLETALDTVALDAPAGSLSGNNQLLLVRADASVTSGEEVEAMRINESTRIGDVADVIFGPAEQISSLRINGETGIGVGIVRQAQSNTLDISTGVRTAVDELNEALPEGVSIFVTSDDAVFVGGALHKVLLTLGEATLIVVGVIFLFLRSWRATIIPAVTVPIALIGTLAAIYHRRVLAQHPDAAGHRSGHRSRRRRRHRRAGEYRAAPRAGDGSARRGGARRAPGVLRGPGDDGDACRRLHPDFLLPWHRRAALRRIRLRDGLRGRPLHAGGAHPLSDDGLANAEGA